MSSSPGCASLASNQWISQLAEAAPMTPYLPTVFSATPNLEITSVEAAP